jgi:hypothetical protein
MLLIGGVFGATSVIVGDGCFALAELVSAVVGILAIVCSLKRPASAGSVWARVSAAIEVAINESII